MNKRSQKQYTERIKALALATIAACRGDDDGDATDEALMCMKELFTAMMEQGEGSRPPTKAEVARKMKDPQFRELMVGIGQAMMAIEHRLGPIKRKS